LLLGISTQAADDADLFSIWLDDALASKDPKIVCHLYATPKEAGLLDEAGWKTANPALGSFRSYDDLAEQAKQAVRMPSSENTFRNLCLNQRVSTVSPFVSKDVWLSCGGKVIEFGESQVYVGLDLSARTDLTAMIIVGKVLDVWQVQAHFWTPEEGLVDRSKRDRQPYDLWVRQGYMHTTPGRTVDYEYVAQDIATILDNLNVKSIGYDRWRIEVLRKEFDRIGVELPLIEFGQGFKDMSPAIDSVESELLNARVAHGNHPVLTMCAANSVIMKDPAGNRKLNKMKSTGRIDGMVAMTMAFGVASKTNDDFDEASFADYLSNPIGM
jgi:phage terminase large subunit-like protein